MAAKICELEGGTAAMLTSSGQAANFFSLFNIASCGDHIVSSSSIYGGTFNLISVTMAKMGIEVTFVSPDCTEEELEAAFRPNTKAVFGETIANPALTVLDIERFANAAHRHGVPLIVDNTFPTPVNCRPIEWGAISSPTPPPSTWTATAWRWAAPSWTPALRLDGPRRQVPRPLHSGRELPRHHLRGEVRQGGGLHHQGHGPADAGLRRTPSPQSAFYLNLGLESLHVRMARHCENGQAVAEFLAAHPKVASVTYCGLPGDKYHALAEKYLPNGSCGVVSFSSRAAGRRPALHET